MKVCATTLLLLLLAVAGRADSNESLEITYVANEGVLISVGEDKILIDAHHYQGNPFYQPVSSETLSKMTNNFPPFDNVDIILSTHMHPDHFDAGSVADHLFYSPKTIFVSADQITSQLQKNPDKYKRIEKQIETITPGPGFFEELKIGDVTIRVLSLPHGGKDFQDIQNVGFIVTVGKFKLLHIGDADAIIENFEPLKLPNEGIDIAFIPYWYLRYESLNKIVDEYIRPGQIIAVHIPPSEAEVIEKEVRAHYPGAIFFTKPMQKVTF